MSDWNDKIIAEFRENAGQVGGVFEDRPLLLLHSTGAKSGEARLSPLMYLEVDTGYAIFASMAGAPNNPAWFHNLMAQPEVSVEIGTEKIPVTARRTEGAERDRIWEAQKQAFPFFAEYEAKTPRQIPVVVLEPRTSTSVSE